MLPNSGKNNYDGADKPTLVYSAQRPQMKEKELGKWNEINLLAKNVSPLNRINNWQLETKIIR